MKTPVASIRLKRLDGRRDECVEYITLAWQKANETIRAMALTAPVTSTHEVEFAIRWADGAVYDGTLTLTYNPRSEYDLAARIRYHIEVVGGRRRPSHLSELEYTVALAKVPAGAREYWADFVTKHEMGTKAAATALATVVPADELLGWLKSPARPSTASGLHIGQGARA